MSYDKKKFEELFIRVKSNQGSSHLSYESQGGLTKADNGYFNNEQVLRLVDVLQGNTTIKTVDFSLCEVGDTGAKAIAKLLESNTRIQHFDLAMSHVGADGACSIAASLQKNTTLCSLSLRSFSPGKITLLEPRVTAAFVALVRGTKTLDTLDLSENGMPSSQARDLILAQRSSASVRRLSLHDIEPLEEDDAIAIAKSLSDNPSLYMLDLKGRRMSDRAFVSLAAALQTNKGLRHLYLDETGISKEAAAALVNAFISDAPSRKPYNTSLRTLSLTRNAFNVKNESVDMFYRMLQENSTLHTLVLESEDGDLSYQHDDINALLKRNRKTFLDNEKGMAERVILCAIEARYYREESYVLREGVSRRVPACVPVFHAPWLNPWLIEEPTMASPDPLIFSRRQDQSPVGYRAPLTAPTSMDVEGARTAMAKL